MQAGGLGGSASADGGLGTDLVRGGLVRDRIDDAALLEIDHEARVDPAVDRRPLALLPAAGVEPFAGGAEPGFDLGHAHAAAGHGGLVLLLHAVDQQDLCRSEEHTSELQSLMRTSYYAFCFKQHKQKT